MKRTVVLSAIVAGLAAVISPVHAGPQAPADAGRVAVADLTFALSHGRTLSLDLRAGSLSGGDTLRVLAKRCYSDGTCAQSTAYESPLAPGALTIDSSNAVAELQTTLAGHALHIRWQPATSNTEVVGGFEGQGGSETTSGSDYEGAAALTALDLDGRTCTGNGAVGYGIFADTGAATGSPDAAPLSALRLPASAPITCG